MRSNDATNTLTAPPATEEAAASCLAEARATCFHCGLPCLGQAVENGGKSFCCPGCLTVHDILQSSGLGRFYELNRHPGIQVSRAPRREQWTFLDAPDMQRQLLDFTDGRTSRVTFHVPAIHCVACVWLLENLFQLHPGIGRSRVSFPRRQVAITFATEKIRLSELVALLASIGYEPRLTLGEKTSEAAPGSARRRLYLQVGLAGFAFGNIMLVSLPQYLGLDSLNGPIFRAVFGFLSLALALPVLVFSAADYFRSALLSFRQRRLTLDVPIALGLLALYAQSAGEIFTRTGEGFLDSLTGLVFFLLCGKIFQQKTYDRLAFDADYKTFFPLSVMRRTADGEESVSLSALRVGDHLVLRNGELIPADARLIAGPAFIDYSFVTGEVEPVEKSSGDYLYAGGRQVGGAIEVETVKAVSQSHLTSLWNDEAFQKNRIDELDTLTNRYSKRFTWLVIAIALGAAAFWFPQDHGRALKAFTSVLIVACPCALALAAPFALGTAQRLLARRKIFLKNTLVLERLSRVDAVVFDKTGTLTTSGAGSVSFHGAPLNRGEREAVTALARQSMHPHSVRIAEAQGGPGVAEAVRVFREIPGCGIEGDVAGIALRLGSRVWLEACGVKVPALDLPAGSAVCLANGGNFRGVFVLSGSLRPGVTELARHLVARSGYRVALLSGDHDKERARFSELLGAKAELRFDQSPLDKLNFVRGLQKEGHSVLMVGDGLNDAGALKQSDVGVAVTEKAGAFSPASDVIVEASEVPRLARMLEVSRRAVRAVRLSFGISAAYNAIGIGIAAAGWLSPVVCAVLMPVSSVTVVAFACAAAQRAVRRLDAAPAA